MNINALPNDLLDLILLHIDSPLCLLRAASTCKLWRHIVADNGFLHRFRSIHGALVAGAYLCRDDQSITEILYSSVQPYSRPEFVPSLSAGIDGRYFSLDFIPDIKKRSLSWTVKDSRSSLILLEGMGYRQGYRWCQDLVICEPLTRRYMIIPPLPTSSTGYHHTEAFILDGDTKTDGISLSNFRVLCKRRNKGIIHAGVFAPSSSWRKINIDSEWVDLDFMGLSAGYLYLYSRDRTMVAVNMSTIELSSFMLPDGEDWEYHSKFAMMTVTGGHDGKVRIALGEANGNLKVFARLQGGGCEWALEKTIHMPAAMGVAPRYNSWCFNQPMPQPIHRMGTVLIRKDLEWVDGAWRLDLDSETVEMERVPYFQYPCELPWPPMLHVCTGVSQESSFPCSNGGSTAKSWQNKKTQVLRPKLEKPMIFRFGFFCLLGAFLIVLVLISIRTL